VDGTVDDFAAGMPERGMPENDDFATGMPTPIPVALRRNRRH
jgi:hypothetical protein